MTYPSGNTNLDSLIPKTAFGEVSTAEPAPLFQVSAQYGIRNDVLTINLGGSTSAVDGNFVASTGVGASNVSAIVTKREAQYKAGQGLIARFTAIFTEGVIDSEQQAGFINSESAFAFGYQGEDYGIIHGRDGALEQQELTITTPAGGSETATVTIDGVAYSVSLTSGTVEHNAYEIAASLKAQNPTYNFTSNGAVVVALARLPDFGGGSFLFSSGSAAGSWVSITSGVMPTVEFTKKNNWNVRPDIDIDPSFGNVYLIRVQYLGYGGIRFYIEEKESADLVLVHVIQYANSNLVPSVNNPIFRIGWAARNAGNTTDVVVKGASCGAFNEGKVTYDNESSGVCHTQLSVGTTRTNVLTLRNRLTYQDIANRAEIIPRSLILATDTTKTAVYEVVVEPEVAPGDSLLFQYLDEPNSLMEYATNSVAITGGRVVACIPVQAGQPFPFDIESIVRFHPPNTTFSIASKVSQGASSAMDVSANWIDDL